MKQTIIGCDICGASANRDFGGGSGGDQFMRVTLKGEPYLEINVVDYLHDPKPLEYLFCDTCSNIFNKIIKTALKKKILVR